MVRQSLVVLLISSLLCGGCATMDGMAPVPVSDPDNDLEQLAKEYNQKDAIDRFYKSDRTEADRDQFIAGRLVLTNIRYLQYVRKLTTDRQLLNSAADVLVISLNLAGAATGGAAEKTVLATISAFVAGSKAVIDKEFYYEKTMPALVAAMNAQRKVVLARILDGLRKDIKDYRFEDAVSDLHEYEFAGSMIGASQAIQVDAAEKEKAKNDQIQDIRKLPTYTEAVTKLRGQLTDAVGLLGDETKGRSALVKLKDQPPTGQPEPANMDDVKVQLQRKVREARTSGDITKVAEGFKAAGISY